MPKLTVDLGRLTLGEMMDVELASGRAFTDLLRSKTGTVLVALYLQALQQRAPGSPLPKWDSVADLTMSEAMQSVSPVPPDSD